jgi:cyclohexanone monooxygenase
MSDFDTIVIGAGFGGIYMLHKLRNGLGLKVRTYDKAGGVGGTWYWNKYPGAMSDTEAYVYQYSSTKTCSRNGIGRTTTGTNPTSSPTCRPWSSAMISARTSSSTPASSPWYSTMPATAGPSRPATARPSPPAMSCALWGCCRRSTCPTSRVFGSFRGTLVHTGAWPEDLRACLQAGRCHRHGFDRYSVHLCGLETRRAPDGVPAVGAVQRPERQRPGEQRVR